MLKDKLKIHIVAFNSKLKKDNGLHDIIYDEKFNDNRYDISFSINDNTLNDLEEYLNPNNFESHKSDFVFKKNTFRYYR